MPTSNSKAIATCSAAEAAAPLRNSGVMACTVAAVIGVTQPALALPLGPPVELSLGCVGAGCCGPVCGGAGAVPPPALPAALLAPPPLGGSASSATLVNPPSVIVPITCMIRP